MKIKTVLLITLLTLISLPNFGCSATKFGAPGSEPSADLSSSAQTPQTNPNGIPGPVNGSSIVVSTITLPPVIEPTCATVDQNLAQWGAVTNSNPDEVSLELIMSNLIILQDIRGLYESDLTLMDGTYPNGFPPPVTNSKIAEDQAQIAELEAQILSEENQADPGHTGTLVIYHR